MRFMRKGCVIALILSGSKLAAVEIRVCALMTAYAFVIFHVWNTQVYKNLFSSDLLKEMPSGLFIKAVCSCRDLYMQ